MIREMGNVELFELCETIPKVQCSQCLLCWNQGVICCTCGHCLVESDSRRKFNKLRSDALSTPHYVIKKERPHGAWHGKTEEQKEYFTVPPIRGRDVAKELTVKKNITKEFTIVFKETKSIVNHNSKLAGPSRSESRMDKLAQEDHTYRLSKEEFKRYQVVSHLEQVGQECADATSIRLSSCSLSQKPSPSRIR